MEQFDEGSDGVRPWSENLSGTATGLQGLQALEGWKVPRSRRSATIASRRRPEEIWLPLLHTDATEQNWIVRRTLPWQRFA